MKLLIVSLSAFFYSSNVLSQIHPYDQYNHYTGSLGADYSAKRTTFRIWSPAASQVELILYKDGAGGDPIERHLLTQENTGCWQISFAKNFKGIFYTYRARFNNKWSDEVTDPYAKSVGVNGKRGMVVDLKETDPPGWKTDKAPLRTNKLEAIIYELHVRDASISTSSGISNKGKFIGLTESSTKNANGEPTGLDHLAELGVTDVHLLPVFDFNSIDETSTAPAYNWGYDPLNYNVPEGSYSTNAYDGKTRIREFKMLVQAFHRKGIRVIMDVVYNHTALTEKSNFNQLVPGYYYRMTADGKFSNATACGNETASERLMMRKFIIESMKYWLQEYHIDGFRIDLMGVHDIQTINELSGELHKLRPDVLIYGEGWTAGTSTLPDSLRALKANVSKLNNVSVFGDDLRDAIKGSVFDHADKGFVSGKSTASESIKFGVLSALEHPQVIYSKVNYSKSPYATMPGQVISYAECHDNHVLWDKLKLSAVNAGVEDRIKMQKLALAIVLTSQGIPFLHAGSEFLRSKHGVENSYNAPDSINEIDWNLKSQNHNVFRFVRNLIKLRKEHPAFRMTKATQITNGIQFIDQMRNDVISYTINGKLTNDPWKNILVIYSASNEDVTIDLPEGEWKSALIEANPTSKKNYKGTIVVEGIQCIILYQD